jgi:hypothetical protein
MPLPPPCSTPSHSWMWLAPPFITVAGIGTGSGATVAAAVEMEASDDSKGTGAAPTAVETVTGTATTTAEGAVTGALTLTGAVTGAAGATGMATVTVAGAVRRGGATSAPTESVVLCLLQKRGATPGGAKSGRRLQLNASHVWHRHQGSGRGRHDKAGAAVWFGWRSTSYSYLRGVSH